MSAPLCNCRHEKASHRLGQKCQMDGIAGNDFWACPCMTYSPAVALDDDNLIEWQASRKAKLLQQAMWPERTPEQIEALRTLKNQTSGRRKL
jgi:hypothetical protein